MDPLALFKCLADDTRLRCTLLLARHGELCVCDLTDALNLSQPKISRHLALLRSYELVSDRRQGKWVYYRINPQISDWVQNLLKDTLNANPDYLAENAVRCQNLGCAS